MRVLLCLFAFILVVAAKMQNVTVKGTVICDKRRERNIQVELWDRDTLDPNDKLTTVRTNAEGEFTITGAQSEYGRIEPFIRFIHSCDVERKGCIRTTEYQIPKKFINGVYDMTYVSLDIFTVNERVC